MDRWRRQDAKAIEGRLQAILRGWLERPAVRGRVGGAEPAAPRLDSGPGNVEELDHELLALPALNPGGHRGAAPARLARAAEALPAQDGRGPLDRDHEPHRAASGVGPVARAHEGREAGRPL